jgi:uncharacterized protein YyaL (SSP411 family)
MGPSSNRLARESSPYLLLHAENPVDWYAWGEEAFDKARKEDKPIFLSVGYSTCYWCHVMERECFSDPEIANQMNEGFVSIKLDREERPDLDEIYMMATQLLTHSGGWPNSVFLTHDRKPFFAGTYFPPADRMGRPGFPRVMSALREAWALRRSEVVQQAEAVAEAIQQQMGQVGQKAAYPDAGVVAAAQALLARRFDPQRGGFGEAPKFPSPSNLFFLLDRARGGNDEARRMLEVTLDRMARGGIHDQIAGGFHRYSTDAEWLVPHFEKMLYDNAALAILYAETASLAPELGFDRVARLTLDFVLREMTGPGGGFFSAIDAETDGHEGAYYTWTRDELESILDAESRSLLAGVYGFDGAPTFEGDRYVLHLPRPLAEQARALGHSEPELLRRMEPGRGALLEARGKRKRPLVDDKILADWNGLMIGAMARVGQRLAEPRYVDAGRRAAHFVLSHLVNERTGALLHSFRDGTAKVPALLDDYAFLGEGLLALHAATGEAQWLEAASRLVAEQNLRLWDEENGGYFAAPESPDLLVRSKPAHDGAVASGNGVAALNLLDLARAAQDQDTAERAERLLAAFGPAMDQWPLAHVTLVRAAMRHGFASAKATPTTAAAAPPSTVLRDQALGVVETRGSLRSAPGPWKPFAVHLTVKEGWHLNANPALLRFLMPTEVKAGSAAVRDVRYPSAERYEGSVTIEGEVEAAADGPVSVSLTYQACDDERCLEPITREIVLR